MLKTLQRRWFLVALVAVLAVGMACAQELVPTAERLPRDWIIASVLFAMALPLPLEAMVAAMRRPRAVLLAVAINLIVVPLLAWLASRLLVDDLAVGMIIAAAVPCTLASATVWTRIAGGNEAVSLLVTMLTNLSCFLITPLWLQLAIGQGDMPLQFSEMATKLLLIIVLPIVLAQFLRKQPAIKSAAASGKAFFGVYAQLGILVMVLIAAVHGSLRLEALGDTMVDAGGQLVLMLVLVAAIHTAAWGIGIWSAGRMGLAREDQIAVAFAGSQKTLTVGLAVALQFGGLAVLPMLAYHVEQLLIDTLLADNLRKMEMPNETRQ